MSNQIKLSKTQRTKLSKLDEAGISYRLKAGGRHVLAVCKIGAGEIVLPFSTSDSDWRAARNFERDIRRLKARISALNGA